MDLLIIIIFSLILVPLILLTSETLRIVIGLVFVIFFPGYTLIAALFPRRRTLGGIERLTLSLGLSIVVVPVIGFILNFTPWGIRLYPIMISLLLFIVIMVIIAWYRRKRLPPDERFEIKFGLPFTSLSRSWTSQRQLNKLLSILMAIAIIGAVGILIYTVALPRAGERFTEFYLLNPEGKAENYPHELVQGEEGRIIMRIVNREHETTGYRVELTIDGKKQREIGPITLGHEEQWEQEEVFIAARAGPNQKVEFLLYKGTNTESYQRLHLWIDVKEAP